MKNPPARQRRASTRGTTSVPVTKVRTSSDLRAASRPASRATNAIGRRGEDAAAATTRTKASAKKGPARKRSAKKAPETTPQATAKRAERIREKAGKQAVKRASASTVVNAGRKLRKSADNKVNADSNAARNAKNTKNADLHVDKDKDAGKSPARNVGTSASKRTSAEGWHGWDEYAAFYDWENARTVGRRDIRFWGDVAQRTGGRSLELGCGTGRILTPLAGLGLDIVGIDRSAPMLARAEARVTRLRRRAEQASTSSAAVPAVSASLLRGDIRQLPFVPGSFDLVMAPYGILQSLVRERDLSDTLRAVFAALAPGGRFGLDLVPDVPRWQEYARRVSMRGRRGPRGVPVTLVESVRQDRAKGLTIFDQEFIEGRGKARRVHRFSLTFRTVSIQSLRHRLERAGFVIDAVLGGYDGRPWDPRADTWVLMASKPA